MITSRQTRSAIAARVALGLVVAGMLAGAAPSYAALAHPCTKHFPVSDYSCTHQAYPNPEYPNHKPLSGNYPGSYTKSQSTPVQQPSSRFDWLAAGVGAAGMLGLILLLTAAKSGARIARNRRYDAPLAVEVSDGSQLHRS
jgi:hypothetical protein